MTFVGSYKEEEKKGRHLGARSLLNLARIAKTNRRGIVRGRLFE
jgi:hypothetical protein